MSEQPERVETWAYTVPGSVIPCADFETARQEAEIGNDDEFTSRVVRLTERRNGETIVGPLETAVIEAAIKLNWLNAKHDAMNAKVLGAKTPSEVSDAIEDRHALMKMRPKIEAEFADSLRALREARKPKEPSNG